jgi:3-keto steroid reductase
MSSFEARADVYDAEDWQLVGNSKPYEASKFEMDLIRAELSRRAGPSTPIRHFTVQPGVVNSSIDAQLSSGILLYIKQILMYLVRLPPHCMTVASSLLSVPRLCRPGGLVRCIITLRHGTAQQLRSTSVSLPLLSYPSFCLPLGHPLYKGTKKKMAYSHYVCTP